MQFLIPAILIGIGTGTTFKLFASGAEDAAQAVDAAGNGALKIAMAAGATYIGLKYAKVI